MKKSILLMAMLTLNSACKRRIESTSAELDANDSRKPSIAWTSVDKSLPPNESENLDVWVGDERYVDVTFENKTWYHWVAHDGRSSSKLPVNKKVTHWVMVNAPDAPAPSIRWQSSVAPINKTVDLWVNGKRVVDCTWKVDSGHRKGSWFHWVRDSSNSRSHLPVENPTHWVAVTGPDNK